MKERPNLDEVIAEIQKMIDESKRSLVRYIHVGTLMDILYLLKEKKTVNPAVDVPSTKIVITTIDALPNRCYECPCHDCESDYCQADKERRHSEYRPYWCPLKEIHDDQEER